MVEKSTYVYDNQGNIVVSIAMLRNGGDLTIQLETKKPVMIHLINYNTTTSVSNATFQILGNNTIITAENSTTIVCKL